MTYRTRSESDTFAFGMSLGALLAPGDIVLLTGELGSGKSVLARGIARAMGIDSPMPSPTFTIMIPYEGKHRLYHFDLYRLNDPDEFFEAGLDEYIGNGGICAIEWPEMAELAPEGAIEIQLARGADDNDRNISVAGLADESPLAEWRRGI